MIPVHIYFSDGHNTVTRFNGTEKKAVDYYKRSACNISNLYFPRSGRRCTYGSPEKPDIAPRPAVPTPRKNECE